MKINRRECRRFADAGPGIPKNSGLLLAGQIKYIVRTAVKNIGHQRTLVLYVYPREDAAAGDFRPKWTMFHGRGDYATLERKGDGTASWRKSAFCNLGDCWGFLKSCAFYTPKDERRIGRFFRDGGDGFRPLLRAQQGILDRRAAERRRKREREVVLRMEGMPPLPRGLKGWVRKEVMPAYFFYDYRKGKKTARGTCTACGREVEIAGVKYNRKGTCPHCGCEVVMKSRGRRGHIYDQATCQVIQRTGSGELVVRIMKATCTYPHEDKPQRRLFESERFFVGLDGGGGFRFDGYYDSFGDSGLTSWKRGMRHGCCSWQYNYMADRCGHVYCGGLQEAMEGTPWQYCPIVPFYRHFHEPMEVRPFLSAHLGHPGLERLVKAGFFNLASDLVYARGARGILDETQCRTHRMLGVQAEDVPFVLSEDMGLAELKTFQGYCRINLRDRQRLLLWQRGHRVDNGILRVLEHMSAHKLMRYVDGQYSLLFTSKTGRYSSVQNVVGEYGDYLDMCVRLGYDMRNTFVLFPRNLQKAHDRVARRVRIRADAEMRRKFRAAYKRILQNLDFEMGGMKIVYPATPEELAAEGNTLHHCVGGYVDRVARQECIILFLRRCGKEKESFYTIEVQNGKVTQVRGRENANATPEVREFMNQWERKVLAVSELPEAA